MKTTLRVKDEAGRVRQLSIQQAKLEASANLLQGKPEASLLLLSKAIQFAPLDAQLRSLLGQSNARTGRVQDAIAHLKKAIELGSAEPASYCELVGLLLDSNQPEEAILVCEEGLRLHPEHAKMLGYKSWALFLSARYQEAFRCASRQLAVEVSPATLSNLCNIARALGTLQESETFGRTAIELDREFPEAHYNLALTLLLGERYEEGFAEYEWRWKSKAIRDERRRYVQRLWDGSPLEGRTLLVYAEQGAGDTIQFARYLPFIDGRVILHAPDNLRRLLKTIPGQRTVVSEEPSPDDFNTQCPLLTLPRVFKTERANIPPPAKLSVPAETRQKWAKLIPPAAYPKIGIVWAGSPGHTNDRHRSIPLDVFKPLFDLSFEFFSFQLGSGKEQLGLTSRVHDLSPYLSDYLETAAGLLEMDLLITVDTSVAHLAASLGRPVWMLVPFAPDWRWQLGRSDSPWYPSLRLFRAKSPDDWQPVVSEIAAELKAFAPSPANGAPAAPITDLARWSDSSNLDPAWNHRARLAADLIPCGATVLDLGCGAMTLEKSLPFGCSYLPCDVVQRDDRTILCNFNEQPVPQQTSATHITMLGVLEYIHHWRGLLGQLRSLQLPVVFSYCPTDLTSQLNRPSLGWVNHLNLAELSAALSETGFSIQNCSRIDQNQVLIRAIPEPTRLPITRRVLVLSYNNVGNFGDRLGFHLLNSVLPANAEVHYAHFRPWDIPPGEFDLLILGIGNSIFQPLLTDELLDLVHRVPRSVGIFGTQYRSQIDTARLSILLDRLTIWFARYEEDVLLYGHGRKNVVHLGDWLISAFPVTQWSRDEKLIVGKEIWNELPLDRTIQQIQRFRTVVSERIHPLLCALTAAQRVAYMEQREGGSAAESGKFRAMLLDIFGRTWPENTLFEFNREAVAAYRARVLRMVSTMPQMFEDLLK